MSNESFTYQSPYSSVRSHQQAPQSIQAEVYGTQNKPFSTPYHSPQAASAFGAPDYQAQRYTQHQPTNRGANFGWHGNLVGSDDARPRQQIVGRDDAREEQLEGDSRSNSEFIQNGSNIGSYTYGSTLSYSSNQGIVHMGTGGFSNQGIINGGAIGQDVNTRILYQPYSRNFEESGIGIAGSNSSQRAGENSEGHGPGEHASGVQSYQPPSQSAISRTTTAASYSSYPSNIAIHRSNVIPTGNVLGSKDSGARQKAQKAQDEFPPRHGFVRNQSSDVQAVQEPPNQNMLQRPSVSETRKPQKATRIVQRQKTKAPPSLVHHPKISLVRENVTRSKESSPSNASPTPTNLTNSTQTIHQPLPGNRVIISQISQDHSAHSSVPVYQGRQSSFYSQTLDGSSSTVSEDPLSNLRAPFPNVPTTVDPTHVYNRYHEYQRQVEAADAEYARLAALRAEREAAEAAAAALASAKTLSQTMDSARSQLENERSNEIRKTLDMPNHSTSNPPILSNLVSPGQGSSQNFPETRYTISGTQRKPSTADVPKVAAMEEEKRIMVEKMREYQTQDPQLFAHVWQSVKNRQIPQPLQAQVPAEEDLIRAAIDSQSKPLGSPVSFTAQSAAQPVARPYPVIGTGIPAKSPRKRKSRAKVAPAEQASENSQRLTAPEGELVVVDAAATRDKNWNSDPQPLEVYERPPQSYREPPGNLTTSMEHYTPPIMQQMGSSNSSQNPSALTGPSSTTVHNDNPALSKSNQTMSTDFNSVDHAVSRQSAQIARSPVETMNRGPSSSPPIKQQATQGSTTTDEQKKTGVFWPDKFRDAIANTAAKVLSAIPENAGKNIAAFQVLDMLGYNPTYIELCELIEGIGFKIDRARFATKFLAAIPGVNSTPAQVVESKVSQLSNNLATSKEYQTITSDPSNVAQGSLSPRMSLTTHGQASPISVEAITNSLAAGHSQTASNGVARSSRGPGSRGPYRKTRERMENMQKNPRSTELRKERPVNHRLPEMAPVSDDINRNPREDPITLNEQGSSIPTPNIVTSQAPSIVTSNSSSRSIEQRPVFTPQDEVLVETNTPACGSSLAVARPPGTFTASNEFQNQIAPPVEQLTIGLRSYALPHLRPGSDSKDASSRSTIKTPPTKEMAARKRTFAEIIDLTSDDIPLLIENKSLTAGKARRIGGTNFETSDRYDAAQEPKPLNDSRQSHLTARTTPPTTQLPQSQTPTPSNIAIVSPVPNPYLDFYDIVKPVDKSVALRKSRYDSRTIARDVLIATARHPFQRGLNAHLEPLKARFTRVNDSSDLSTFRWDIVDPGAQLIASAIMSTSLEEKQNRTPVGNSGLSSNKVNLDNVELPVHRGPIRPTRGIGSIRSRGRSGLALTRAKQPAQPSGLRYSSTLESNFAVVIESAAPETSKNSVLARENSRDASSPARRRGRPPKSHTTISHQVIPLRKRVGRPPKDLSRGNSMRGTAPGRQVGRPRIHPVSKSKTVGRPRKSNPKLATPKFIPFMCEWRECKAELHNLDTLRRHIYSVHNKVLASGGIACQWSKCGLTRQVNNKSTPNSTQNSTPKPKFVHEYHEFGDMQLFTDHVERAHLIPVAWHMGDGPQGSTLDGSESDTSAYPSYTEGNQITSSLASQVEEDESPGMYKSRRLTHRSYDPALESPVELATSAMKANFSMGTEWKKIKAPSREERLRFDQI